MKILEVPAKIFKWWMNIKGEDRDPSGTRLPDLQSCPDLEELIPQKDFAFETGF